MQRKKKKKLHEYNGNIECDPNEQKKRVKRLMYASEKYVEIDKRTIGHGMAIQTKKVFMRVNKKRKKQFCKHG